MDAPTVAVSATRPDIPIGGGDPIPQPLDKLSQPERREQSDGCVENY